MADFLRWHRADPREWMLNRAVLRQLFEKWGAPQIDLFTTAANHCLPMYCALGFDQRAVHHDGLSLTWIG